MEGYLCGYRPLYSQNGCKEWGLIWVGLLTTNMAGAF